MKHVLSIIYCYWLIIHSAALLACRSQSEFWIHKIRESRARALFFVQLHLEHLTRTWVKRKVHSRSHRIDSGAQAPPWRTLKQDSLNPDPRCGFNVTLAWAPHSTHTTRIALLYSLSRSKARSSDPDRRPCGEKVVFGFGSASDPGPLFYFLGNFIFVFNI